MVESSLLFGVGVAIFGIVLDLKLAFPPGPLPPGGGDVVDLGDIGDEEEAFWWVLLEDDLNGDDEATLAETLNEGWDDMVCCAELGFSLSLLRTKHNKKRK